MLLPLGTVLPAVPVAVALGQQEAGSPGPYAHSLASHNFFLLFWRVKSNILTPNGNIFCLNKNRNIAQIFTMSIIKFLSVFNQEYSQRQLLLFKMLKLVRIFSMQRGKTIKLIVEVISQAFLPQ